VKANTYTPRSGSKAALGIAALLDGPMNCAQLGAAMDTPPNCVHAMLQTSREHGSVGLAKDDTGLAYFYLVGMPLDDRFTVNDSGSKTTAKKVKGHRPPPAPKSPKLQASPIATAPKNIRPGPTKTVTGSGAFLAGLLSNGELLIDDGNGAMTLCVDHTNQLIAYLDKARSHV
jgi:hypothetical protein